MILLAYAARGALLLERQRVTKVLQDGRVRFDPLPWPKVMVIRWYHTPTGVNCHVYRGNGNVVYSVGSFPGLD